MCVLYLKTHTQTHAHTHTYTQITYSHITRFLYLLLKMIYFILYYLFGIPLSGRTIVYATYLPLLEVWVVYNFYLLK